MLCGVAAFAAASETVIVVSFQYGRHVTKLRGFQRRNVLQAFLIAASIAACLLHARLYCRKHCTIFPLFFRRAKVGNISILSRAFLKPYSAPVQQCFGLTSISSARVSRTYEVTSLSLPVGTCLLWAQLRRSPLPFDIPTYHRYVITEVPTPVML